MGQVVSKGLLRLLKVAKLTDCSTHDCCNKGQKANKVYSKVDYVSSRQQLKAKQPYYVKTYVHI
jgi:hypothetical protein